MSTFTGLYDACILFPAPVRDLFMHLALTDLFRAKWTDHIHEEWINALLRHRPDLSREVLEHTRQLMNENVRDCLVEGYERLIPSLELPDEGDRHVLAAAIVGRADVIITFNLKDFPSDELNKYGIEAQHPDEFVHHLFDLDAIKVCAAAKMQRESLKNPPKTVEQFIDTIEQCGLPMTANKFRELAAFL